MIPWSLEEIRSARCHGGGSAVADALDADPHLSGAISRQDAVMALSIVNSHLYGAKG